MAISEKTAIVVNFFLYSLATIFVSLRVFVGIKFLRTFSLADGLVVFAWMCFTAGVCMDYAAFKFGFLTPDTAIFGDRDNSYRHALDISDNAKEAVTKILKMNYTSIFTYCLALVAVKMAFCNVYMKLIPQNKKALRITLYCTIVIILVGNAINFIMLLLWCRPISQNWSFGESNCVAQNSLTLFTYWMVNHVCTDIIIYILPFFLLSTIRPRASRGKLLGVITVFSLGFICLAVTIGRVISSFTAKATDAPSLTIWNSADQTGLIVVISCPPLKRLWDCRNTIFKRGAGSGKNNNGGGGNRRVRRRQLKDQQLCTRCANCRQSLSGSKQINAYGISDINSNGKSDFQKTETYDEETEVEWTLPGDGSISIPEGLSPRACASVTNKKSKVVVAIHSNSLASDATTHNSNLSVMNEEESDREISRNAQANSTFGGH